MRRARGTRGANRRGGRGDRSGSAAAPSSVEALPSQASHPALGVRLRLRRPRRCSDHSDTFGAEHVVEAARELAVAVADQEAGWLLSFGERHHEVARLLGNPTLVRIGGHAAKVNAAAAKLDEEYSRRSQTVSTVRKSQATIADPCARRNCDQLSSARRGAGSIPRRRRIAQIVLGASAIPSPTSSPWMRRYPQVGFSRAMRSTSSQMPLSVRGRPRATRAYVQRRATSWRCQRKRVTGDTKKDDHADLGSERLTAAAAAGRRAAAAAGQPDAARHAAGGVAQGARAPSTAPSAAEVPPSRTDAGPPST
jgi:hypothetical protein